MNIKKIFIFIAKTTCGALIGAVVSALLARYFGHIDPTVASGPIKVGSVTGAGVGAVLPPGVFESGMAITAIAAKIVAALKYLFCAMLVVLLIKVFLLLLPIGM